MPSTQMLGPPPTREPEPPSPEPPPSPSHRPNREAARARVAPEPEPLHRARVRPSRDTAATAEAVVGDLLRLDSTAAATAALRRPLPRRNPHRGPRRDSRSAAAGCTPAGCRSAAPPPGAPHGAAGTGAAVPGGRRGCRCGRSGCGLLDEDRPRRLRRGLLHDRHGRLDGFRRRGGAGAGGGGAAGASSCAGAGAAWLGITGVSPGLGRWSTVGRMLTASEITSATTPTTKIDVKALPTSRNGLRLSSS